MVLRMCQAMALESKPSVGGLQAREVVAAGGEQFVEDGADVNDTDRGEYQFQVHPIIDPGLTEATVQQVRQSE